MKSYFSPLQNANKFPSELKHIAFPLPMGSLVKETYQVY